MMTQADERKVTMNIELEKPTTDAVRIAGEGFDEESKVIEKALTELFGQYPYNSEESHVLLKVVALNDLYSTQIPLYSKRIPSILDIVQHIVELKIDSDLDKCLPGLVNQIASITVEEKEHRYNYSFATKYCSWHRADAYPIFDSRVGEYLWHLRNLGALSQFKREVLWDYPVFKKIVVEFQETYHLSEFKFKDIDKFLWSEGGKLFAQKEKQAESTTDSQQSLPESN